MVPIIISDGETQVQGGKGLALPPPLPPPSRLLHTKQRAGGSGMRLTPSALPGSRE